MTFEEWWYDNQDELIGEYSIALAAWNAAMEQAQAEFLSGYKAAVAEIKEGYVLVPVEPTEAMISYMETGYLDPEPETPEDHVKHIYRMMLLGLQDEE